METLPGPLGSRPKRVAGKGGTRGVGGAKGWDSVLATGRASLPIAAGKWEERGGEGGIGDLVLTQIWPSNLDSVTGLWNVLSGLVYRRHKEPSIKRTPEGREARFNSEPRLSVPWVLRGCCRTFLGFTVEMFVVSRGVYTRVFSVFRQHVRTGAVSSVLLSGCSLPRARVSVSQPTSAQVTPGLSLPSDPHSALSSGVSSSASGFLSNAQPAMPHTQAHSFTWAPLGFSSWEGESLQCHSPPCKTSLDPVPTPMLRLRPSYSSAKPDFL